MNAFKRWEGLKRDNPDSLILLRTGDFYEAFYGDAVVVAKVVGLTIVTRHKPGSKPVPMTGFPHHSLDLYLQELVAAGYRVAVCEEKL